MRPPRVSALGFSMLRCEMPIRAAFYIDGFNAYHALDALRAPHLKWLNWWALAETLIPSQSHHLSRIVLCTATRTDDVGKQNRHRKYVAALESVGVTCLLGHFSNEPRSCRHCGEHWQSPVEKQGDVNLALTMLGDAYEDVFDHCYLVTTDGDHVSTVRNIKNRFPSKSVTTVVITGRSHNRHLLSLADDKMTITRASLERSLFPKLITGEKAILRPAEYDPPGGG